jgi:hypothetical protein
MQFYTSNVWKIERIGKANLQTMTPSAQVHFLTIGLILLLFSIHKRTKSQDLEEAYANAVLKFQS